MNDVKALLKEAKQALDQDDIVLAASIIAVATTSVVGDNEEVYDKTFDKLFNSLSKEK